MAWNGTGMPSPPALVSWLSLNAPSLFTLLSAECLSPFFFSWITAVHPSRLSSKVTFSVMLLFPWGKTGTSFSILLQHLCFSFYYFLNYNYVAQISTFLLSSGSSIIMISVCPGSMRMRSSVLLWAHKLKWPSPQQNVSYYRETKTNSKNSNSLV